MITMIPSLFRDVAEFPGTVPPVFADRNNDGIIVIIGSGRNLTLEGFLVCSLKMAQRLRTRATDPGVLFFFGDNVLLSTSLDIGKLQLFSKNLCELLQRDFHFQQVLTRQIPCPAA